MVFESEGGDACEADSVAYQLVGSMSDSEKRYDTWLRRNPLHPGREIDHGWTEAVDGVSEGVSLRTASQELGVSRTALPRELIGHADTSVGLSLNLEAAGWGTVELWVKMQANYDLVQKRRYLGRWPGGATYTEDANISGEAACAGGLGSMTGRARAEAFANLLAASLKVPAYTSISTCTATNEEAT